jgi:N-acyl-D-amino-acid deacylase
MIAEVADLLGVDGLEAMLTLVERDHADAIYHQLSEANTRVLMRHPQGMIGSDGNAVTPGTRSLKGKPHPRYFGTFPRVLGRYVRDERVLTLEEAIHKMTAMPAGRAGLHDRGRLQAGKIADIAIFNPDTIADHATFQDPAQYATGVDSVLVGGRFVLRGGEMTGQLPGRVLART